MASANCKLTKPQPGEWPQPPPPQTPPSPVTAPSSHSSLLLHSAIAPLLTSSSMLFPLSYHDICCDYLFSTLSAIAWYQETTFRPPQFPSFCCYCSPSPWIHLLLKLLSSNHKRPSSIAGTTSHHPSLPSRCCCCCPPLLSTSIHLSCHRLCCCYYSNYFFSTLLTLAWYLETTISISYFSFTCFFCLKFR